MNISGRPFIHRLDHKSSGAAAVPEASVCEACNAEADVVYMSSVGVTGGPHFVCAACDPEAARAANSVTTIEVKVSNDGDGDGDCDDDPEFHYLCGHCEKSAVELKSARVFKRCGRCKGIRYCGVDCQRAHHKKHKPRCDMAIEHRRSGGGGGEGQKIWASEDPRVQDALDTQGLVNQGIE